LKILFDHQIFTQVYGGISRYFCEIIKYAGHLKNCKIDLSLFLSNNQHLGDTELSGYRHFFDKNEFRGKYRLMDYTNLLKSRQVLKRHDFDIFHPTYYDPYFIKYLGNRPFVLTIHDMIHEALPSCFDSNDPTTHQKRILAQKAKKIIAISESTKKDIIKYFNIEESKIEVIYYGNSSIKKIDFKDTKLLVIKKYILYVGHRYQYKNFIMFIKGVRDLLTKDQDLHVLCVGGGGFCSLEKATLSELGIESKVHQIETSNEIFKRLREINNDDQEVSQNNILSHLYQNAECFVFPSLYEGFGMPVLEAFMNGCPAALSNVSSLPEVGTDGALFFDPTDQKSIESALKKILYDQQLRKNLIEKGIQRQRYFSWENTVKKTMQIYKECLSDSEKMLVHK